MHLYWNADGIRWVEAEINFIQKEWMVRTWVSGRLKNSHVMSLKKNAPPLYAGYREGLMK